MKYWYEDESAHSSELRNNSSSNYSKSSSTPLDNPPVLQSNNINTSTLKDKRLDIMYLKNLLSEVSCVIKDNDINMHLEKCGGRGNKI